MEKTVARAGVREWLGLAVLALPTLLLAMDATVLYLAIPHLGADLRPSDTELLWIVDSYGFLVAGFLVTMGTLGDRIGGRRLLVVGATAFAPDPLFLIVARGLLGIALGVGVLGVVGTAVATDGQPLLDTTPERFTSGLNVVALLCAVITALLSAAVFRLLRSGR